MIKIKKIELKNFMSFLDTTFEFNDTGLYLINGRTGSGKTTIFDGILWCLYGKTGKKVKADEVVNDTTGENCSVTLYLEDGKEKYQVIRYRKHEKKKDAIELYRGKRRSNKQDVQAEINKVMGMTDKLFLVSNCISGDESSNILNIQKGKRVDIFEEIFGLSGIDVYEKKCSTGMKDISGKIKTNTEQLVEMRTQLKTMEKSVAEYNEHREEKKEEVKEGIKELQETVKDLKKIDVEEVEKLNEEIGVLLANHDRESEEKFRIEKENNDNKKNEGRIAIELKGHVDDLSKLSTSVCYVCNSVLDKEKVGAMIKDKRKAKIKAEKDLKSLEAEIATGNVEISALNVKLGNLGTQVAEKEIKLEKLVPYEIDTAEIKSEIKECNLNIKNLKDALADLELDKFVDGHTKEIGVIKKGIPKLEKIETAFKKDFDEWTFWKTALDIKKDGNVKQFRIRRVLIRFNKLVDQYIQSFFPEMNIFMSFDENLDETIIYNEKVRSFKQMSKGQQRALNRAISFAFFAMGRLLVTPLPFMAMDEILDGCDTQLQALVMDVLSIMAEENVIYLISHEKSITDSVDGAYEVSMEDEVSMITKIF